MASEYHVQVLKSESISPHMRRLALHGDALRSFPPNEESGYVKMLFAPANSKAVRRSFTIRAFDKQHAQLTLDIVDHGDVGVAAQWLRQCQPGDDVIVRGPGEKKLANPKADWFFLAGDMTALPAIAVNLEALPDDAKGYAIIQISAEEDKQLIGAPKDVQLHWLVNNEPEDPTKLMNAIRQKPWLDGTPYPWFAGEFETMRQVRGYFRDEKEIDRKQMYSSSYWKHGDTDEGMKQAKRRDTDA